MLSVSTYASQLMTLTNIQRNQSDYDTLSRQVASGVKSSDLADYGAVDAGRLLTGQQEVQRLEAYNQGIDVVTPRLKAYDLQLSRMDDLSKMVADALSMQDSYDGAKLAEVGTLIDNTLKDLNALLNEQIDGRYLWAGGNYTTAPVADLSTLPILATPTAFAAVADPALPDYYAAAPGSDATAWVKASFSPETGKTVEFGQVASDPSIQEMIHALQLAKSGLDATDPDCSNRAEERDVGHFNGGRGSYNGQGVRIIDLVGRNDGRHDLSFKHVSLGKHGTHGAVDQPADQGLTLGSAAFTAEKGSGDFAAGVEFFLIVDGQGEEVLSLPKFFRRNHGTQNLGITVGDHSRTIRLASHLSCFNGQGLTIEFHLDFMKSHIQSPSETSSSLT